MPAFIKLTAIAAITAVSVATSLPVQSTVERMLVVEKLAPKPECVKVSDGNGGNLGTFECTDDVGTMRKWMDYEHKKLSEAKKISAVITYYTRESSCHNPKWVNGVRQCLTAAGVDTEEGVTVACPKSLRLGTKVEIYGHTYTCTDRTADWVQDRNGATFDIFVETGSPMPPGKRFTQVIVIDA